MRLFLTLAFSLGVLSAANGSQPITATDVLRVQRVTEVRVAQDGSFAVYGVRSVHTEKINDEDAYSYRTHLFLVDLNSRSAKPRQLTFGDRRDGDIAISPDGKTLAFVRDDTKKVGQIWLLPLEGLGEAHQVTTLENGAADPVWHPSGRHLLVTTQTPLSKLETAPHFAMERPRREWFDFQRPGKDVVAAPDGDRKAIRNWLERNGSKDNPVVINRLVFQAETGLNKELRVSHLYRIDLEEGNKTVAITKGALSLSECVYAPSGAEIACQGRPETKEHPDRVTRTSIWLMKADGSSLRMLLDDPRESFTAPLYFPDGKTLLVRATEADEPTYRQSRLAKLTLSNNKIEWISQAWKADIDNAKPASDGTVWFASNWHGGVPLLTLRGAKLETVVGGPTGVGVFDIAAGRTVYSLITVANPNELYLRDRDGKTRLLTDLNTSWLKNKRIIEPVEKWITRPDGTKVQTWTMNPANATPGKKYPWVLEMHGGPTAMWGPGEFTMWHEFQLLCSWGYGVTYSNPRGSGGYGYDFQKANFKNWGEGPAGDVLAALDETLQSNPLADRDRLFLTGGSYAGYLTAWIVSHDHRFKAAAAQRGVYDLTTFYGEGNAFRLVEHDFGGRPYDDATRRLLEQQSPFTYAKDIKTPLLILHGSVDLRTGVSQSEMLYRALKQLNRDVEYVRYPGAGHELTRSGDPRHRMDHMLRIIEFFERYANNDAPAPTETR